MSHATLRSLVEDRADADASLDPGAGLLVLAALDGGAALEAALGGEEGREARSSAPPTSAADAARGAFLRSIAVEGFRGIGPEAVLELSAGPGLTLVVGRNGSGKSSFAEGLELLLTGSSKRWDGRSGVVWKEGWRNLHHATGRIAAELLLEGESGPCRVWREWPDGAGLDDATTTAQVHGRPQQALADLGWEAPLQTYRPFLSYNELGSVLEEGPTKLHDALSSILGLEDLNAAQKALAEARLARERVVKAVGARAKEIAAGLADVADDRAARARTLLEAKRPDLEALETLLTGDGGDGGEATGVDVLRRIAVLEVPTLDALAATVEALRAAGAQLEAARGTLAARSRDLASVLDHALRFHQHHGDGPCPVCGREDALTADWHAAKAREAASLRDAAKAADEAHIRADQAMRAARGLPFRWETAFEDVGLDAAPLAAALRSWTEGAGAKTPEALADHVEEHAPALAERLAAFRDAGRAELDRRQGVWRPHAAALVEWLGQARQAEAGAGPVATLKAAEAWLKAANAALRDERFAPIGEKADAVWRFLRQQSHVELGPIRLQGTGSRRRLSLDVTVDGVEGAALGVMSQGELHALALSLFIPRATLPESPFRFVVIDDPVQSMDPARVEGLAEALEETARDRQVVVFTHDDRLPEAVRRMGIPARIFEVTRREGSLVQPRLALDPVARHIQDAMALVRTESLPSALAAQVVPGLCRQAAEAACQEAVRRRRLGAGGHHADVERLLEDADTLKKIAALALFDDAARTGDVLSRLNKEGGRSTGDLFQALNSGSHEGFAGDLEALVRDTEKLSHWLRERP